MIEVINKYFREESSVEEFKQHHVLLFRRDGLVVYMNKKIEKVDSIGALVSGMWQAADALNGIVSEMDNAFRLSFDKSDRGLHILKTTLNDEDYFLCSLYEKESNPAKLKQKLRNIKNNLEKYASSSNVVKKRETNKLFENITDDEMDKIFSFVGEV